MFFTRFTQCYFIKCMKTITIFSFFFILSIEATVFSQVSFDDGKTYYTDSSQTRLCEGKFRAFYPGYKLKSSTTYAKGKLNGELIQYYEDGKIKAKVNYLNGLLEGEPIEYSPDTNVLKSKFHFSNGLKNGECTTYTETGEVDKTFIYLNDVVQKQ